MRNTAAGILLILVSATTAAEDAPAVAAAPFSVPADNVSQTLEWREFVRKPYAAADPAFETGTRYGTLVEALENESFAEAEVVAKQMVDELVRESGPTGTAATQALINLAAVQFLAADYDAARLNFQASINRIEDRNDMLSPDLVLPLRGLAASYAATEQPAMAARSLDRALHISNVNAGPHNPSQIPILLSLLDLNLEQGDDAAALSLLDRMYLIEVRENTLYSDALLPMLNYKAGIEGRLGRELEERNTYRQIIDITRRTRGKEDLSLVEPYLQIARTFVYDLDEAVFRSLPTAPTAEWYFRQALDIAESNPAADTPTRNRCLLSLADYYTVIGSYAKANALYVRAWELLGSDDEFLAQRRDALEINQPLSVRRPGEYADFEYGSDIREADPDELLEGFVTVTYAIDEHGATRNIEVAEADPAGFSPMEIRVRQAVKSFIFRPRYAAGQAVATADLSYTHNYYYRPSDLK